MRPRFIIVNIALATLLIAAWAGGFLTWVSTIAPYEIAMITALGAYAVIGIGAAFAGRFNTARHIANGLPIWALCLTGLGILLAGASLHSIAPDSLVAVFKNMILAISPNVVGIVMMGWLREAMHWSAGEEI